jgi:hypothetical protein
MDRFLLRRIRDDDLEPFCQTIRQSQGLREALIL